MCIIFLPIQSGSTDTSRRFSPQCDSRAYKCHRSIESPFDRFQKNVMKIFVGGKKILQFNKLKVFTILWHTWSFLLVSLNQK